MDKRTPVPVGLLALGLLCACSTAVAAATHCNPDYIYTWSTVQSSAVSVPAQAPPQKTESATSSGASTASASGGGDDAGNLGEGGGGSMHKRGLRWQSFLPGVIK